MVTHPFSYSKIERNTCTGSSALLGLNVRLAIEPMVLYSSPQPGPRSRPDEVFGAVNFSKVLTVANISMILKNQNNKYRLMFVKK